MMTMTTIDMPVVKKPVRTLTVNTFNPDTNEVGRMTIPTPMLDLLCEQLNMTQTELTRHLARYPLMVKTVPPTLAISAESQPLE